MRGGEIATETLLRSLCARHCSGHRGRVDLSAAGGGQCVDDLSGHLPETLPGRAKRVSRSAASEVQLFHLRQFILIMIVVKVPRSPALAHNDVPMHSPVQSRVISNRYSN